MSVLAAGSALAARAAWLADDTDVGDETHKAGPIAIVVIVVLCVACFFLFRSMSGHLRHVRDEFPTGGDTADGPGAATDAAPVPPGPAPKADAAAATGSAPTDGGSAPHTAHTRPAPRSKSRTGSAGDTRTR